MKFASLSAVILLTGCLHVSQQEISTVDLLQGEWTAMHDEGAIVWSFSGNELRMLLGPQSDYRGTFSLDDSVRPIQIDFNLDEYRDNHVIEPHAVQTKGILSLDGETLTIVIGIELQDYPKSFEESEGLMNMRFQRTN